MFYLSDKLRMRIGTRIIYILTGALLFAANPTLPVFGEEPAAEPPVILEPPATPEGSKASPPVLRPPRRNRSKSL